MEFHKRIPRQIAVPANLEAVGVGMASSNGVYFVLLASMIWLMAKSPGRFHDSKQIEQHIDVIPMAAGLSAP